MRIKPILKAVVIAIFIIISSPKMLMASNVNVYLSTELVYDDPYAPGKYQWVVRMFMYKSSSDKKFFLNDFTFYYAFNDSTLSNPKYYVIVDGKPILAPQSSYSLSQGIYNINPNGGDTSTGNAVSHCNHRKEYVTISKVTNSSNPNDHVGVRTGGSIESSEIFRVYFDVNVSTPKFVLSGDVTNPVYLLPNSNGYLADVITNNVKVTGPGINPGLTASPTWLVWPFCGSSITSCGFKSNNTLGSSLNSSSDFSGFATGQLTLLPVDLTIFYVLKDGNEVILNWETASEINNSHFEIERSVDTEIWSYVGQVSGAGNSHFLTTYEFKDMNPASGVNYYRLKQVDFDGNVNYSEIREVIFSSVNNGNLVIYPNPANGQLNIVMPEDYDNVRIEIKAMNGQILKSQVHNNSHTISISLQDLASGMYYIHVTMNNQFIVKSFFKL
jgi:hypothetical protein